MTAQDNKNATRFTPQRQTSDSPTRVRSPHQNNEFILEENSEISVSESEANALYDDLYFIPFVKKGKN